MRLETPTKKQGMIGVSPCAQHFVTAIILRLYLYFNGQDGKMQAVRLKKSLAGFCIHCHKMPGKTRENRQKPREKGTSLRLAAGKRRERVPLNKGIELTKRCLLCYAEQTENEREKEVRYAQ